jgi:hypothetical protein
MDTTKADEPQEEFSWKITTSMPPSKQAEAEEELEDSVDPFPDDPEYEPESLNFSLSHHGPPKYEIKFGYTYAENPLLVRYDPEIISDERFLDLLHDLPFELQTGDNLGNYVYHHKYVDLDDRQIYYVFLTVAEWKKLTKLKQ